jgi:hypothetical protein
MFLTLLVACSFANSTFDIEPYSLLPLTTGEPICPKVGGGSLHPGEHAVVHGHLFQAVLKSVDKDTWKEMPDGPTSIQDSNAHDIHVTELNSGTEYSEPSGGVSAGGVYTMEHYILADTLDDEVQFEVRVDVYHTWDHTLEQDIRDDGLTFEHSVKLVRPIIGE